MSYTNTVELSDVVTISYCDTFRWLQHCHNKWEVVVILVQYYVTWSVSKGAKKRAKRTSNRWRGAFHISKERRDKSRKGAT